MTVKVSQVKKGTIKLSKQLQKTWEGSSVYFFAQGNSLIIKKMEIPTLSKIKSKLKSVGKQISEEEIADEIKAVRNR